MQNGGNMKKLSEIIRTIVFCMILIFSTLTIIYIQNSVHTENWVDKPALIIFVVYVAVFGILGLFSIEEE